MANMSMSKDKTPLESQEPPRDRILSDVAKRALSEAQARREIYVEAEGKRPRELGGRKEGKEPARYGDWEVKGIASDF